ncbi:hypothetical protein Tco_0299794 [Tanacetum coccineum]
MASISILINGAPSKEFNMQRGLRQGDPLSPFLFLLVAEALQLSIIEACNKGIFNGVSLVEGVLISPSFNTRMMPFFGKWSRSNARNLILILKCFEEASGLKVNLSKIRLFNVGVDLEEVEAVSHFALMTPYLLYFRLGKLSLSPLVVGLPLLSHSLEVFLSTSFSLFNALLKFINLLQSLRRRFFWSVKEDHRGITWVKWDSILVSPKYGGLGVGSLRAKNLALLGKWKWRFLVEKDALWRQDCKVGNRWVLENDNWCSRWAWRITLCGRALDDLQPLVSSIGILSLSSSGIDKWVWKGDPSVKHLVAEKSQYCVWRASINRLPTRLYLVSRGIVIACKVGVINNPVLSKILNGVLFCVVWAIWKWRNKVVFAPATSSDDVKIEDIFPLFNGYRSCGSQLDASVLLLIGADGFLILYLF